MKLSRSFALHVALLAALAVIMGSAGTIFISSADAQGKDATAVKEALLQSTLSFEKNDLAAAAKVWANDKSLTVFESGHANYGWPDYRDNHLAPEMSEMKDTKYALSDIQIHLAGKTAWATFKYSIAADVIENGKTRHVEGSGLGTAILEKRADGWRIVHWHSSAPRRSAATPKPQ
jgi:ketosteroid isomerase-like protein